MFGCISLTYDNCFKLVTHIINLLHLFCSFFPVLYRSFFQLLCVFFSPFSCSGDETLLSLVKVKGFYF